MTNNNYYGTFLAELNSAKFQALRPSQEQVLGSYLDHYKDCTDVAVELPTGAGKTLIALLIAENRRRLGDKVAILSANKTLARQMLQESKELGIPSVLLEGTGSAIPSPVKRSYQRSRSIGIMNYWVYFNQNPVIDPADMLIMDDAHLAEHCLHSLYSVEITRVAHPELFEALVLELHQRFPEYSILADALDLTSEANRPPELLSFIDQAQISSRLEEIIDGSSALNSNMDLRFRWQRMRARLNQANIYLAPDSLWIRPYIYPLLSNNYYSTPTRRLYMSATIGDPGDLSRRLGVKTIKRIPVPQEHSESTFGRRLILMNRRDEGDIPDRLGTAILTAIRIHPKSVWLCSSVSMATKFKEIVIEWLEAHQIMGHPSWILTPEGDEIEDFKQSETGHLFVGGRFDGMDFNGNECRMVVLTTLPRAINTQEEFISAYLRDSGFMRERLNQRVIQALGRCNRADGDYAVYA
ncbi:MAG: DEAD/DEAH box helicase, partial [Chloroflexi bacterium]|nr:DEAD/DEAH box helicase [Chloroflexota bacterium]